MKTKLSKISAIGIVLLICMVFSTSNCFASNVLQNNSEFDFNQLLLSLASICTEYAILIG